MAGFVNKSCEKCGGQIERPMKISDLQWSARKFCSKRCAGLRRSVSDSDVARMYLSGQSSGDIASAGGISAVQVRRILRDAGVKIRTGSEAQSICKNTKECKAAMSKRYAGRKFPEAGKEKLSADYGPAHPLWRGGVTMTAGGYAAFTASPANGDVAGMTVHRVIGEAIARRRLGPKEHVHHIDGDKTNNSASNLTVMTASDHARLHASQHKFRKAQNA
mgnify:FL=1